MYGIEHQTDYVFGVLFALLCMAIIYLIVFLDEKSRNINNRNRANKYRKTRTER